MREDQSVRSLTRSHLAGSGGVEAVPRSLGPLLERTPNLRSAADAVAETVHHPAAKVLFNKGDSGDAFYVLEEGVIEISVISLASRSRTFGSSG